MMKLTICFNCKTKFKHDNSQKRKFCSQSCSAIVRNKLQAKPKEPKKVYPCKLENLLWREYWNIKLHNFPLDKMTQQDYEDYDKVWKYEEFENNKS